ncbi:Protein CLEC-53 [Aphelenchoides avenae]|nr:Protein CLEC-53 [Aphelenchus avenae]
MSPAWNVVLLFALALVGKSLAAKQCPPGTEKGVKNGDCYSFSRRPGNWATAVSLCTVKNGTLASASSGFVNNFLRVKATRWAEDFYWLGGVYTENPLKNISGWRWLDDTPFKYTAWASGQPGPKPQGKIIAASTKTGLWSAFPSLDFDTRWNYICSVPAQ